MLEYIHTIEYYIMKYNIYPDLSLYCDSSPDILCRVVLFLTPEEIAYI